MAGRDLFQTSDLVPLLAERGIHLSREQVFRRVTQPPQRLSMDTLAALCDILECTPNDLIEIDIVNAEVRKSAVETGPAPAVRCGAVDNDPPARAVMILHGLISWRRRREWPIDSPMTSRRSLTSKL